MNKRRDGKGGNCRMGRKRDGKGTEGWTKGGKE
jgi:hypothetical protein